MGKQLSGRHLEVGWLADFLSLCESRHFGRAADKQHLTQPAFSRRIRMLEEWLNVDLFDRSTHPVALTDAGHWFRPIAEEVVNRLMVARAEAQSLDRSKALSLRFAATHALSLTFFPHWLRGIEKALHVGPVHLVSDTLQACEGLMLKGHAQFLLCHYHPAVPNRLDAKSFKSARVGSDRLMLVASAKSRADGSPQTEISGDHLQLLDYSAESGLGRIVRAVRQDGARSGGGVNFVSHLAVVLKAMMLEGRGVAWLPQTLIQDELQDGSIVEVGPKDEQIPVEIHLFRRRSADTAPAEGLWDFLHPSERALR